MTGKPGCRKKTPHKWFETQDNIAFWKNFEKEKIVWQEIVREPSFTYENGKMYCEATSFLMVGKNLKYILGLLNSMPITFFFKTFYAGGGLGNEGYRYKKAFLEQIPLPPLSSKNKHIVQEIENLVNKILSLTQSEDYLKNPQKQAKVKQYQRQIDQLVYKLYNLTEEEIKIIEEEIR